MAELPAAITYRPTPGILRMESKMAICPYCKKPVTLSETAQSTSDSRPVRKEVFGKVKKEVMYSCPHCGCVLGFGFFLGGVLTGRP